MIVWRRFFAGATLLMLPVAAAFGDEPSNLDARMRRLEDLIQRQEQKIQSLETMLQIADEESLNAARATEVKRLIREVLRDTDFRSQLVATTLQVGYSDGFYIKSSDDNFSLKLQVKTQFRYIGGNRQTDNPNLFGRQRRDDLSGFEWERARLVFSGHLFSKNLTYYYQLQGGTDEANQVRTRDLYFDYAYLPSHKIRWGQFKVPQGRQRLDSAFRQQVIERSMVSGVFDLGRSIGIMAHGTSRLGGEAKFKYMAGVFNGFNNQNDDVRDVDTNMAVATRGVFEFGDYGKGAADLRQDTSRPAAQVGLHFGFNDDNNDTNGPPLILTRQFQSRAEWLLAAFAQGLRCRLRWLDGPVARCCLWPGADRSATTGR